jgi:hypothetical protein
MAKPNTDKSAKKSVSPSPAKPMPMLFDKSNFIFLLASIVIILTGFILMRGSEDVVDVTSTKLTVAPVLVILGFVVAIFSIMKKPSSDKSSDTE